MITICTDLNAIKIKNLKISTSVYLSLVNWERVFPMGYPPFLFRHALMPMSSQFGSAVVPQGFFVNEVRE